MFYVKDKFDPVNLIQPMKAFSDAMVVMDKIGGEGGRIEGHERYDGSPIG